MIDAKVVAKYTEESLDFHICNALIKCSKIPNFADGISRSGIISEIRRATTISDYLTPVEANPGKVSKRLAALQKLNIVKNKRAGSTYKWAYNTGITLDEVVENESVRNATIDIKSKSKVIITSVEAINPNPLPKSSTVNLNPQTQTKLLPQINNPTPTIESAKLLNIVNRNQPKNPLINYYFIRYKALYRETTVKQSSMFIAIPFAVYSNDHQQQIETKLLEELRESMLIDSIKLIILQPV
jgi:hypothetical protein